MSDFIDVVILQVLKPEIPPFSMVSGNQDGGLDARRARATRILSFFLIFFLNYFLIKFYVYSFFFLIPRCSSMFQVLENTLLFTSPLNNSHWFCIRKTRKETRFKWTAFSSTNINLNRFAFKSHPFLIFLLWNLTWILYLLVKSLSSETTTSLFFTSCMYPM